MRTLAVAAGAFSAGTFAAQYLLPEPLRLPAALVCLLAGVLSALALRGHARRGAALIGCGVALALCWSWAYTAVVQAPAEELADTEHSGVSMTLLDYAQATSYGAKATVRLEVPGHRPVRAVYYGGEELLALLPGNVMTGDVALSSAAHIRDDDITTFTSKGVFLLAYDRGGVSVDAGSAGSLRWWPARLGRAVQVRIGELFDGDTAAFLTAILTGDKSGLSSGRYTALAEAGLLHILAVSGMHCAFLLTIISAVTGRQRRRLTAGIAVPVLVFYALLTGCSPSVVRACVMLIFLLAGPLFRRESDPPTAMAAALALILLQNPYAAASVSLQLSFGAVAGLLWLTPKLTALLLGKHRAMPVRFVVYSFSATAGALVFTVPLTAYYFNSLVLAAPLSSLLCLPAAGAIFTLGLAAVGLSFLTMPLAALLGCIPAVLIRYVLWAAESLSALPYHAVYFTNPYLKYWLVFAYGLLALAYFLKNGSRRRYALAGAIAAVTLAVTVRAGAWAMSPGVMDIRVMDVGQGACALVTSGSAAAVIDCGSANSWYDPGNDAADMLFSLGHTSLDCLVLTHYDSDHVNGVEDLMDRMPVRLLAVPDTEDDSGLRDRVLSGAEDHGVPVRFITEQETLSLGRAELTLYPPVGEGGDNERCLAALASAGDYDLLITGDMDAATERALLAAYDLPDIEALAVGHHGARTSASEELLAALTPETAVISVGYNSYGHPAPETLRRLVRAGAEVCRTDLQGTVHITVN